MQVGHCLAAVRTAVDRQPEPAFQLELPGKLAGDREQVAEQGVVRGSRLAKPRDDLLRDDQEVHGSLRTDVMDRDAAIVLVLDFGRDFPVDDALEERLGHGSKKRKPAGLTAAGPGSLAAGPHDALKKEQLQVCSACGSCGGEGADECQRLLVVPASPRRDPPRGRKESGTKVGDEQGCLAERGKVPQTGHQLGAREQWCRSLRRQRGVPVEEPPVRAFLEEPRKQVGGGCIEFGVVLRGRRRLGGEFGQAESDGAADLLGQIEVVAREVREQRVDEVQPAEIVA